MIMSLNLKVKKYSILHTKKNLFNSFDSEKFSFNFDPSKTINNTEHSSTACVVEDCRVYSSLSAEIATANKDYFLKLSDIEK